MLAVIELARAFSVTTSTIRNWSKEFSAYLSPFAAPDQPGDQREFTEGDAAILAAVAEMRRRHAPYSEIHAALAGGERGVWPPPNFKREETPPPGDAPGQLVTQLTIQLSKTEGKLTAVSEERDYLRVQLDHARQEAQTAAVAAARAQGELSALQTIMQAQAAPQTQEAQETAVSPDHAPDHAPDPPPSLAAAIRAWWEGRRQG